jgi:hypothetical protein
MKKLISVLLLLTLGIYFVNFALNISFFVKNNNFSDPKIIKSDEMLYLKVYYLMKSGAGYYSSLPIAFKADSRKLTLSKDVFMWRLTTIYYFWDALTTNGNQIAILFFGLAIASLFSIFLTLKKFVPWQISLIGPFLLSFYFKDILNYPTSIFFHEWWGWFFMIFGITSFLYGKKRLTFCFLTLSVLTRELFMIPMIFFFIYSLKIKKNRATFLVPVLIFLGAYFAHGAIISKLPFPAALTSRHLSFNKTGLSEMISFSMRSFPFIQFRSNVLLVIISLVSSVLIVLKKKNINLNYLLISCWSLFFILPFIVQNFNDYWGVTFMPTMIGYLPLIFVLYEKSHKV